MAIAAELPAEIARQRAHVKPFAATRFESRALAREGDQLQGMNFDRPRREHRHFAVAREIIGALARHFDGGEDRRALQDPSGKGRQRG